MVLIEGLPDVSMSNTPEPDLALYADKTGVTKDWVREHKPHARSFCGIPVEIKGKLWGVVVLDSRSHTSLDEGAVSTYRMFGKLLGKSLERS